MLTKVILNILSVLIFYTCTIYSEDTPCAARAYPKESVVCVCNATYCDTITRKKPDNDTYIAYTSNAAGLRFSKSFGQLEQYSKYCASHKCSDIVLTLDPRIKYQDIKGFGGAVTDATAMNWFNMTDELKQLLIDSYFSESGLEYNIVRVPIGCSDFSTHPYAYNEEPENDVNLDNFDLSEEDYNYKIPMLKAMMKAATAPIYVMGTVWSPPRWMKTPYQWNGFTQLKPEYYQTYALYYLKFIQSYEDEGVPIWAITTGNEPIISALNSSIPCMGFSAGNMGKWIGQNLGPTLWNSTFKNVQILAMDDQRALIPYYFNLMVLEHPECLEYIDGVALHFYMDFVIPPNFISFITKLHSDKYVISSEASTSFFGGKSVILGSWARAVLYISDIIQNLNYKLVGWLDWNMVVNEFGGPNYIQNFADSPVLAFNDKGEFIKQPMFYAIGHFSKFFPRGSRVIKIKEDKLWFSPSVGHVAVVTPDGTVALVLHNKNSKELQVKVRMNDKQLILNLSPLSVTTVELPYEEDTTESYDDRYHHHHRHHRNRWHH